MANCDELKLLTEARVRSTEFLIQAKDWHAAAYLMGYALECKLKSVICATLNFEKYPPDVKDKDDSWFKTHRLDRLLLLSGLSHIFNLKNSTEFAPWSGFTKYYEGDWQNMRYEQREGFNEISVPQLYQFLTCTEKGKEGIIPIIDRIKC